MANYITSAFSFSINQQRYYVTPPNLHILPPLFSYVQPEIKALEEGISTG